MANSSLDSFDPNSPTVGVWATYIPSRKPKFKVHKTRGHAKSAFHYVSTGILYESVDGEWVERHRSDGWEKSPNCSGCGADVVRTYDFRGEPRSYNNGCARWDGFKRITLCLTCVRRKSRGH